MNDGFGYIIIDWSSIICIMSIYGN